MSRGWLRRKFPVGNDQAHTPPGISRSVRGIAPSLAGQFPATHTEGPRTAVAEAEGQEEGEVWRRRARKDRGRRATRRDGEGWWAEKEGGLVLEGFRNAPVISRAPFSLLFPSFFFPLDHHPRSFVT